MSYKKILKIMASHLNLEKLERIIAYPIHQKFFISENVKNFKNKEAFWDGIVDSIGKEEDLTYVEFGVWTGVSLKYFLKKFNNRSSKFIGLDSFEGLPEKWGNFKIKTFDTEGNLPKINDERLKFVKGLFQNTSDVLFNLLQSLKSKKLLVHFDADLYTSTLFCLTQLDRLDKDYYVFFDEFTGHESRALSDYIKSFNSKFKIISQVNNRKGYDGYPDKMFGKIIHRKNL